MGGIRNAKNTFLIKTCKEKSIAYANWVRKVRKFKYEMML